MTVQERVAAGMAWLDTMYPTHVERFNPDRFDIMCRWHEGDPLGTERTCVLVQATREMYWSDACATAGIDDSDDEFAIGHGFYPTEDDGDRAQLNQAWLDAYAARKIEIGC